MKAAVANVSILVFNVLLFFLFTSIMCKYTKKICPYWGKVVFLHPIMDNGTEIQVRESEGCREVFDPVRRRWVALTPEEWVRQHTLQRLHKAGYPMEVMQVEGAITLNGMTRRCDIVVYRDGQPWMIVECKKCEIPLTQKVCDQACRYNTVLRVPYLMLTNGKQEVIIEVDYSKKCLQQLHDLPLYEKKC